MTIIAIIFIAITAIAELIFWKNFFKKVFEKDNSNNIPKTKTNCEKTPKK